MLGEDHSLIHEFPEFRDTIIRLTESDKAFSEKVKRYNALDKEIRKLELKNSPIQDAAMYKLKHDRSILKRVNRL